jgi:hypothetical protein
MARSSDSDINPKKYARKSGQFIGRVGWPSVNTHASSTAPLLATGRSTGWWFIADVRVEIRSDENGIETDQDESSLIARKESPKKRRTRSGGQSAFDGHLHDSIGLFFCHAFEECDPTSDL